MHDLWEKAYVRFVIKHEELEIVRRRPRAFLIWRDVKAWVWTNILLSWLLLLKYDFKWSGMNAQDKKNITIIIIWYDEIVRKEICTTIFNENLCWKNNQNPLEIFFVGFTTVGKTLVRNGLWWTKFYCKKISTGFLAKILLEIFWEELMDFLSKWIVKNLMFKFYAKIFHQNFPLKFFQPYF